MRLKTVIDIWLLSEDELTGEREAHFRRSLSHDERCRADRYRHEEDRRRSVAARGLLRHALNDRVPEIACADWPIEVMESGRPVVAAPGGLSVSVTHTPGLVAVAVTEDVDVGVDAEWIDRRVNFDQVARRFFAPSERDELAQLPDSERRRRFFRYWVLKEAYAKARGLGLAIGLDRVRFIEPGEGIVVLEDEHPLPDWSFEVHELSGGLLLATAAARAETQVRLRSYAAR